MINQALELAQGDYIAYATDDNVYHKQKIEKMVDFLENNPNVMVVYSASETNFLNEKGEFQTIRPSKRIQWLAPCVTDHCSIMHRKTVLPVITKTFGSILG